MKPIIRYLVTGAIVLAAIAVGVHRWRVYLENPWTRDGQVQANVIQIAPRVSGPIVTLPIRDNQFVHAGDLLLEIDPRTYQASLDQARAQLDQAGGNIEASVKQVESARAGIEVSRGSISQAEDMKAQLTAVIARNKAELERQQDLLPKKATSQKAVERAQAMYDVSLEEKKTAEAAISQAEAKLLQSQAALAEAQARLGALGDANPQLRLALAAVRQAELNLEFTKIHAPTDGYIANLRLRLGSHVVANQPTLALVDTASYWVDGFFKENQVGGIALGRARGGHAHVLPGSAAGGRRGQRRLGHLAAGREHRGRSPAEGQRDIRVDPAGAADSRARAPDRRAEGRPTARGHDLFGAGQQEQRIRQQERERRVSNPVRVPQ